MTLGSGSAIVDSAAGVAELVDATDLKSQISDFSVEIRNKISVLLIIKDLHTTYTNVDFWPKSAYAYAYVPDHGRHHDEVLRNA